MANLETRQAENTPQETIVQMQILRAKGKEGAKKVPCGIEPRSLDSESRALTATPRDQLSLSRNRAPWPCADCPTPYHVLPPAGQRTCKHSAAIDVEDTEQRS